MTDLNDTRNRTTTHYTRPNTSIPSHLQTFDDIYTYLTTPPKTYPVLPQPRPTPKDSSLTHIISLHQFHPVLESLLHIMNSDLSSAHFLLRHMESPPALEAMYLHGILHRVEGDYRNTEAWYGNVSEAEVFLFVWGESSSGDSDPKQALNRSKDFIGRIEKLRKNRQGDLKQLEGESKRELDLFAQFAKEKFGTGKVEDARDVWVERSEEQREMSKNMVVGGEGWRKF